jgi:hypothetical protein
LYRVEWSEETLAAVPPAYRHRCARDDLELESIWLVETDLEPDPDRLRPRPLRPGDPADRVRAVFGLTSDDPVPPVDAEHLARYHRHLTEQLAFPFKAIHAQGSGRVESVDAVLVRRLLPPEQADPERGLCAEAVRGEERVVRPLVFFSPLPDDPGAQVLRDYARWVLDAWDLEEPQAPLLGGGVGVLLLVAGLTGAMGAMLAALWYTVPGAPTGALAGAGVLGLFGALFGVRYEVLLRGVNRLPLGFVVGGLFGAVGGAAVGAFLGALALAYYGAIPGAIAGTALTWVLRSLGWRRAREMGLMVIGAYAGGFAVACHENARVALTGAAYGAGLGALAGTLFVLSLVLFLGFITPTRG